MELKDQKLAAVRLVLGDALARKLIEDSWNAVNELSDPFDEIRNTGRFNIDAAALGAEVISQVIDAMDDQAQEFDARQQEAFNALTDDERHRMFEHREMPASYAAVKCGKFPGPEPKEFIVGLLEENRHLRERIERLEAGEG